MNSDFSTAFLPVTVAQPVVTNASNRLNKKSAPRTPVLPMNLVAVDVSPRIMSPTEVSADSRRRLWFRGRFPRNQTSSVEPLNRSAPVLGRGDAQGAMF